MIMGQISLICPLCGKNLYTEDEHRYFDDSYGCTITCTDCSKRFIGVDLSVCAKCVPGKMKGNKCMQRLTVMVKYHEEE